MKIVHVSDTMAMGGAENVIAMLCRTHREQGHDSSVLTHMSIGPVGEQLQAEGIAVELVGPAHLLGATRNFYAAFRRIRPDVVHCHNPTATIYAAPAARFAGARRVISTRHSLVAPPHNMVREWKYAVASRFCDSIVGVSEATRLNLLTLPFARRNHITRVYNGVAPLREVEAGDLPRKTGFTLLYVGRLAAVKDHATLLRAVAHARKQVPDLQLWMVGDGPTRSVLEQQTRELNLDACVTFVGEQLDPAPYFRSADTFIMSSRSEGLPMSLLQAMSAGLLAIVTDVGGMGEVVRDFACGAAVPVGDHLQMAKQIVRFASVDRPASKLKDRAKAAFAANFTLDRMAASYLDLYTAPMTVLNDSVPVAEP